MIFSKNTENLKLGIDLSMKQHTIIYKEACTILTHRLIKLGKNFRYVVIKNGSDLAWLNSISTITRLCKYLVDSTKVFFTLKWKKYLHFCFRVNEKVQLCLWSWLCLTLRAILIWLLLLKVNPISKKSIDIRGNLFILKSFLTFD